MSKKAIYIILGVLVLLILGVLIFVLKNQIDNTGSSTQVDNKKGSSTVVAPPVINDNDIAQFAESFRTAFEAWHNMNHCLVINQAVELDSTQLKKFAQIYVQKYGITVRAQMDAAFVWCFSSGPNRGQELYDKLTAL